MEESVLQFTSLYWGAMILVKDKNVEQAMINFSVELKDYQNEWSDLDRLKIKANDLIEACRKSAATGLPS